MPPATEPTSLVQRSTNSGPNFLVIFFAAVGGILLVGASIGVFIVLRRRNRKQAIQQSTSRITHQRTISDTSSAFLLHSKSQWQAEEDAYTPDYRRTSFVHMHERNESTDSLATAKPSQDEKFSLPPVDTTPFLESGSPPRLSTFPLATYITSNSAIPANSVGPSVSLSKSPLPSTDTTFISEARHSPKRDLSPLTIPAATYSRNHPLPSDSPTSVSLSARSDSPDSLYSQGSALSQMFPFIPPPKTPQTARYAEPEEANAQGTTSTPIPRLLPLMIPRYTHPDEADVPARSDTRVVGKLLKQRAKLNPNKIDRTVSRIERVGSIRPVHQDSDGEDNSAEQSLHPARPRRSKKRKPADTLVPMGSLAERSEYGATPPSSSQSFKTVDVPAPPLDNLPTTNPANSLTLPPTRPLSLFPSRPSSQPRNQSLHGYSRSVDGLPRVTMDAPLSQTANADPVLPKAHIRQYSAERTRDVIHPGGRIVSTPGLIGGN